MYICCSETWIDDGEDEFTAAGHTADDDDDEAAAAANDGSEGRAVTQRSVCDVSQRSASADGRCRKTSSHRRAQSATRHTATAVHSQVHSITLSLVTFCKILLLILYSLKKLI